VQKKVAIFEELNFTEMFDELVRQCLLTSNVTEIVKLVINKDKDAFNNERKKCLVM